MEKLDPAYENLEFQVGAATPLSSDIKVVYGEAADPGNDITFEIGKFIMENLNKDTYKYAENHILADLHDYVDSTYREHYKTDDYSIECFDVWIAMGDSTPTFRNTALKYLWRYGKKNGSNKADLMKALHYTMMCLYVDHYKDVK
jgi:hypothetical protein